MANTYTQIHIQSDKGIHHRKKYFGEEYYAMFEDFEVDYDDQYLFKVPI